MASKTVAEARKARLAAALRENLKRRKARARAARSNSGTETKSTAETEPASGPKDAAKTR